MADAFVSEVPPTLCSQGGIPTDTIAPLDCPQTKQGSSANNRGTSPASERLANHTSGSEPATAKTVESVRERIIGDRPCQIARIPDPHRHRSGKTAAFPSHERATTRTAAVRTAGMRLVGSVAREGARRPRLADRGEEYGVDDASHNAIPNERQHFDSLHGPYSSRRAGRLLTADSPAHHGSRQVAGRHLVARSP